MTIWRPGAPSPTHILTCAALLAFVEACLKLAELAMSGVEAVVGLALGVLPLLISATEHYDDCLRPFIRYKNFAKEADRFRRLLSVQKTIFRNQCRILLEGIVDHDAAARIINCGSTLSNQDVKLEEQLVQLLGESKEACITTTEMIRQRLHDIQGESHELWSILDKDREVPTFPLVSLTLQERRLMKVM